METRVCWDVICCHLHPVNCSALCNSGDAAFICTPSSSWLLEGDSLATCSLFTGQGKCSRNCFAAHVKLQFYWIPVENATISLRFKFWFCLVLSMAIIISFLPALTHSRSSLQSISLQHPGESSPLDLVSAVLFCNPLLISLVDEMSSKLHTGHTCFREELGHICALSRQAQLRAAQWQDHFSGVYFIQPQKVLQPEEPAEECE